LRRIDLFAAGAKDPAHQGIHLLPQQSVFLTDRGHLLAHDFGLTQGVRQGLLALGQKAG
jgi:hypothetical protein